MHRRYELEYNGERASEYGLKLYDYPEVGQPERNLETYQIPGRDGSLTRDYGTYGDRDITCTFSIQSDLWQEALREAKRWLLKKGSGVLRFSDNPEYFYRVKTVQFDVPEREILKFGTFQAAFTCHPYQYVNDGTAVMTPEEAEFNPYDVCHPIYRISGEGNCLLTVNGKSMAVNVKGALTIDTDRSMAYGHGNTPKNTSVTGEYADLWLAEGRNSIHITEGFELKVIPGWRCL